MKALQNVTALVLAGLLVSQVQAQAVDIPASVSGTYTLTYDYASTGSPFTNGTVKTFVLDGAADTMCVDGVSLGKGYFRSGSGSEMLWSDGSGIFYALSLLDAGGFSEINVYSPSDAGTNWKGQFPGPGTYSSAVTCTGGSAQTQTLTSEQEYVIALAAELYPDLFASHGDVKSAQGYTYLTFDSNVSVGFKDGLLYLAGGPFGAQPQSKGTVSQVTTQLTNLKNSVTITPTADMTSLFNFAAQVYPGIFTNGTSFQTDASGYLYKYFDSGVYAAIRNGTVYVRGGSFGNAYKSVGALNAVLSQLQTAVNGGNNNNNNNGGTTNPGLYNLTVSGTITMTGIVNYSVPFTAVSLGAQVVPLPTDNQGIHQIAGSFGAASGSGSYSVEVINNTSSRITYRIKFSGTYSGLTANYDLTFDYTK